MTGAKKCVGLTFLKKIGRKIEYRKICRTSFRTNAYERWGGIRTRQ